MRMPALSTEAAAKMIETAVSLGINYFDHATCYGDGEAETRFGDAISLTEVKREDLIIQSKCGLRFDKQIHLCSCPDTSDNGGSCMNYSGCRLNGRIHTH